MMRKRSEQRSARKQAHHNKGIRKEIIFIDGPYNCSICNTDVSKDQTQILTNEEVFTRKAFWRLVLDHKQKLDENYHVIAIDMEQFAKEIAQENGIWVFCNKCSMYMGLNGGLELCRNLYIPQRANNRVVHAAKSAYDELIGELFEAADKKHNYSGKEMAICKQTVQDDPLLQVPNFPHFSSDVAVKYKYAYHLLLSAGLTEAELPPTMDQLTYLAQKITVKGKFSVEFSRKVNKAVESGKQCEICGWKDGDGVKPCFYSDVHGAAIHSNSKKMFKASLSQDQLDLYNQITNNKPTHTCGGTMRMDAPYYIKCDKCGCQIKCWEHGMIFNLE